MAMSENEFRVEVLKSIKSIIEWQQAFQPAIERHENACKDLISHATTMAGQFERLLDMVEENREAINDLIRKSGDDELPPFNRGRFSPN